MMYRIRPSSYRRIQEYMANLRDTHKCDFEPELAEIYGGEAGDDGYRFVCNICGREDD